MAKEDRSGWVAVAPEFSSQPQMPEIRKASSAYQFFQKDVSAKVRTELVEENGGSFDISKFGRAVRDRWNGLNDEEKEYYNGLARQDASRFARESHQADVAAELRREKLRRERDQILLDDEGGTQRTTRKGFEKKQRKKSKKAKAKITKGGEVGESEAERSGSGSESSDSDSDDSSRPKKKATTPRKVSQKQIEYREKARQEKNEKEQYISNRQEDLRKERASQAKRRLDFLLKQSNIFSHFGKVEEDASNYGSKTAVQKKRDQQEDGGSSTRRDDASKDQHDADLEEADATQATYLTAQPTTLGFGKMRQYQLEGLNWMVRLQENGVNGILADEMGLGKTLQSISVLVYMMEYQNVSGPHLIIVPKSTLSNWMNEIARWAPKLKAVKFHGDKAAREEIVRTLLEPAQRDEDRMWHVCVATYEVCNIEKNTLNKFAWNYLIIDEAHRLKNEASAFSQTVREFETRYRLLLTGTPLQNSLHELWALLNFLVPDVFKSSEQFDEWFNLDIDDDDEKNKLISQLHKILRPFMLRRLKADVEKSLPPKHETILYTGMSVVQKKLYRDILIRDIDALQGASGSRTAVLNIVMQLRKCAGHPYLFPGVEDRSLPPLGEHLVENCGKMVLLDKLLKRLHERGHRVLLFTQMTRILDILEDYLVMRRFQYCRIDGSTSYDVREAHIEAYNAPNSEKFLFLLSTRAGGLGINLQTADVVILYDSDWNPQADLQAQDRAHRIGQKRAVQVFRFVTEHTIEEKIVERAQQKLKLDAMVVQQGRLKGKDSLSRDELLAAVRFGADKIFKSKDSSITDDDIDLILDAGKRKTEELNEKLKDADKGDLLDFKLDGSSVQTFEGVDYSNALSQAKAEAEMLGIFDLGKRERNKANYNENSLYHQQVAALHGSSPKKKPKKRKPLRLPRHLRLPRMEEWQMFDRESLLKIQEAEEEAFKELPEEQQKMAIAKPKEEADMEANPNEVEQVTVAGEGEASPAELPPLIDEEKQALKEKLLAEGFSGWNRPDYTNFIRASARHGRQELDKIAMEVGKDLNAVKAFAAAFWGDIGKSRISESEYDRVVKLIERGEKKIGEVRSLERGVHVLVSLFDNPWEELQFVYVNCKDKMFTVEEDRHLLCWTRKYGYGQWQAIKMAIRRCPKFRFDYFLRSLPVDLLGRRCEQLMKAAEKEVEHIETKARESAGLPTVAAEGENLAPIVLPKFHVLQRERRKAKKEQVEKERRELEVKVDDLEAQIKDAQKSLRALTEGEIITRDRPDPPSVSKIDNENSKITPVVAPIPEKPAQPETDATEGATGPDGDFVSFPAYDGSEPPMEWKKPFTLFCVKNRKEIKASLSPSERKNKKKVNGMLKDNWIGLSDEDKDVWRKWCDWDKKRFARDEARFASHNSGEGADSGGQDETQDVHIPKKRRQSNQSMDSSIPKKKRR